jgi:hypothetical protein
MREPDFIIGGLDDPYLLRWYIIPRNRVMNIYLHQFLKSDEDRALHDHPWINVSLILWGQYLEHSPNSCVHRVAGGFAFRRATALHRIELIESQPCWTLFLTGPKIREWGFQCSWGWRHWRDFTDGGNGETVGKGCEE